MLFILKLRFKPAPKNIEIEAFDVTDVSFFYRNIERFGAKIFTQFPLQPKQNEKEWMLICSRGDYMEMTKILSKTPYLAQKKDPFNVSPSSKP